MTVTKINKKIAQYDYLKGCSLRPLMSTVETGRTFVRKTTSIPELPQSRKVSIGDGTFISTDC